MGECRRMMSEPLLWAVGDLSSFFALQFMAAPALLNTARRVSSRRSPLSLTFCDSGSLTPIPEPTSTAFRDVERLRCALYDFLVLVPALLLATDPGELRAEPAKDCLEEGDPPRNPDPFPGESYSISTTVSER